MPFQCVFIRLQSKLQCKCGNQVQAYDFMLSFVVPSVREHRVIVTFPKQEALLLSNAPMGHNAVTGDELCANQCCLYRAHLHSPCRPTDPHQLDSNSGTRWQLAPQVINPANPNPDWGLLFAQHHHRGGREGAVL
jgi:hypothetical protein